MEKLIFFIKWLIKIPAVIRRRKEGMSVLSFLFSKLSDLIRWRFVLPFARDLSGRITIFNKFIDNRDLPLMKHKIKEIRSYDLYLRNYLVAHNGLKSWEYGILLCACNDFRDKKLLEIGPGGGTFHLFLKERKGAEITCLELKDPLSDSTFEGLKKRSEPKGVKVYEGTVLNLPFENNTFDIVTCISTIEHLQIDSETRKFISYSEFIERTKKALKEISRVLKKGGRLYLTTDGYIPELAEFEIYEVYKIDDINNVFIKTLIESRMETVGQSDYNIEILKISDKYSNYRGRYITTFSIYMEKK